MSDVIKLLPDSVANQIAAGEVIQRPASVIKELVENAIDAGATSIQIILKDSGRTLIQVIDNGCGMSATDARLAFERHSTSKIRSAADLFSLNTMGFRGEALASIAAIAQVELRTQKEGDEMGTQIQISASQCEKQEPICCGVGSNFMIKNIFFNVPARRKFLKNNQVELSNILREFERLALVNNNVDFEIINNDNNLFKFSASGFKKRIVELFGRTFETQLIPVNVDTSIIRIEGFICRPENARKRNQQQFMFVNGRYMRHPYFHKAIVSSYNNLIPADEQPNYFLNFQVDPESIDVNIHPTKTEIKFENENAVWQMLTAAIKETLGKFSVAPSIDFDTEGAPEIPVFDTERVTEQPQIDLDPGYNPFATSKKSNSGYTPSSKTSVNQDWDKLYNTFIQDKEESLSQENLDEGLDVPDSSMEAKLIDDDFVSLCLQLKGKYIISQVKSGLMLIDQHRAHIKILFDKFIQQRTLGVISSQRVLFPEVLHLSSPQNIIMDELQDDIKEVGFDIAYLGDNSWSVNSIPSGLDGLDVKDTLFQVLDSIIDGGDSLSSKIFEHIALVVSKKAAISYGRSLTQEEMENIQSSLLQLSQPNYTPDGKLIIHVISIDSINKSFQ